MAVKKIGNRKPAFAGIVVAGASRNDAVDRYVAVATGEEAQLMESGDGRFSVATLSSESSSFRNPITGENDMVAVSTSLTSTSSGAQDDVEAFYTVCADGCGDHILADSEQAVPKCPSCSTAIRSLSDDEVNAYTTDENNYDKPSGNQGIVVAAQSLDEAEQQLVDIMNSESSVLLSDTGASDEMTSQSSAAISYVSHTNTPANFSPFFGTASVEQLDEDEDDTMTSVSSSVKVDKGDAEVNYFQCCSSACGSHVLATHDTPVFCPSCSSALLDPEDVQALEDELASNSMKHADDLDDDDDGDLDLDIGTDDDDDDDDDLESESGSEDDCAIVSHSMDDDDDMDLMFEENDEDEDDFDEDDGFIEADDLDADLSSESNVEQEIDMNLMTAMSHSIEGGLNPSEVMVAFCGNMGKGDIWTAFYNQMPIATANVHEVPETLRSMFPTDKYSMAVLASCRENGVEQGLKDFGFTALSPDIDTKVSVSAEILAQAQAQIDEAQAQADERESAYEERMGAALATAAMGIGRGVIKGASNPIRDNLIAALSAAGVGTAQQIVDQVFASHSDNYAKILIANASDIASKPLEIQNQLAETFGNVLFQSESSSAQSVDDIGTQHSTVAPAQTQHIVSESSAVAPDALAQKMKNLVNTL